MIKSIIGVIPIGFALIFIGCGDGQSKQDNDTIKSSEESKRIQTMPPEKEVGCGGNQTEISNEECSEEEQDASKFILRALSQEKNSLDSKVIKKDEGQLRGKLDILLEEIEEDENRNSDIHKHLENLVSKADTLNSSETVKQDLENFIGSIDEMNFENEEEKALGRLDSENLINIKDELELLVTGSITSKEKRKEIESRLESLVEGNLESKKSLKQTRKTLINLVDLAEKEGTDSSKKFANSVIEDVSNKKIKILEAKEDYILIEVKKGDSLSGLAQRYYGDGAKHSIIYEANIDKIGDKKIIYPGIKLIIPKI